MIHPIKISSAMLVAFALALPAGAQQSQSSAAKQAPAPSQSSAPNQGNSAAPNQKAAGGKSRSARKPGKKNSVPSTQPISAPPSLPEPETINVPATPSGEPKTLSRAAGSMLPADVEKLLANIRMADYRIDDLLTDVNPQRWKLSPVALGSFQKMNAALHTEMKALDGWRGRFEKRPDSIYLGFETYTAINQVLPRLTGVAHAISQNENANYGAQFSEAGDHLFDLQQTLGTYLESLLGSQDQMIMALDNNLAGCQNTLSYAMRSSASRPIPMRNEASVRPERRRERKTARNRREKAPSAKSSGSSPAAAKKNPPAAKDAKKL